MVTVSSNNTVEKDMKTKHVKKQIPATEKSASSDTQKSVETLENKLFADLVMNVPTITRKLTLVHQ